MTSAYLLILSTLLCIGLFVLYRVVTRWVDQLVHANLRYCMRLLSKPNYTSPESSGAWLVRKMSQVLPAIIPWYALIFGTFLTVNRSSPRVAAIAPPTESYFERSEDISCLPATSNFLSVGTAASDFGSFSNGSAYTPVSSSSVEYNPGTSMFASLLGQGSYELPPSPVSVASSIMGSFSPASMMLSKRKRDDPELYDYSYNYENSPSKKLVQAVA